MCFFSRQKTYEEKLKNEPCIYFLNNVLCFLLDKPIENKFAIYEIIYVITKSGGYFTKDNSDKLKAEGFSIWLPVASDVAK